MLQRFKNTPPIKLENVINRRPKNRFEWFCGFLVVRGKNRKRMDLRAPDRSRCRVPGHRIYLGGRRRRRVLHGPSSPPGGSGGSGGSGCSLVAHTNFLRVCVRADVYAFDFWFGIETEKIKTGIVATGTPLHMCLLFNSFDKLDF